MTKGIHHITAISSDPQRTYDFYSKILGLRLVKKSVNQDDTATYHLFFGDRYGHPGMDLTFFTFQPSRQGHRGNGVVSKISLSVPQQSLSFWNDRFIKFKVKHETIKDNKILFFDEDDQQLELVGLAEDDLDIDLNVWVTDDITKDIAIRSFYSATLRVNDKIMIDPILVNVFGYRHVSSNGNIDVYKVDNSKRGAFLEIEEGDEDDYAVQGAGTVHHIAFRAKDLEEEMEFKSKITNLGLRSSEVIDRFYFKSVYFQTPAGILFEIATDEPGFTADEDEACLGEKLALPPFLEDQRAKIESNLTPIL